MRCLSVGREWIAAGGRAELLGDIALPFVARRCASIGVPIVARSRDDSAVLLVDLYDEEKRALLGRDSGRATRIVVDDMGETIPPGYDAVWNPNPYGNDDLYSGFDGEIIAGEGYVPIRDGLPLWEGGRGGAISFGGGMITAGMRRLAEMIPLAIPAETLLWVGGSAPRQIRSVMATDIWREVSRAGWLITSAGSTLWEAAAVGIPVVVMIFSRNHELAALWAGSSGAPVLDMRDNISTDGLARSLATSVRSAAVLPHLQSGTRSVVDRILALIA